MPCPTVAIIKEAIWDGSFWHPKPRVIKPPKPRDYGRKGRGVTNFAPSASGGMYLYAVELSEWDGVVKLGRTGSWRKRKNEYANWNHRQGDGIARAFVIEINEEFADLPALEVALIENVGLEPFRGREWFYGSCEDVMYHAERLLGGHDISFTTHEE